MVNTAAAVRTQLNSPRANGTVTAQTGRGVIFAMNKWWFYALTVLAMVMTSALSHAQSWDVSLQSPALSAGDSVDFPSEALDWGGAMTVVFQATDLGAYAENNQDMPAVSLNFENGFSWLLGLGPASMDGRRIEFIDMANNPLSQYLGPDGLVDGNAGWIFDLGADTEAFPVKTFGQGQPTIIRIVAMVAPMQDGRQALRFIAWQDGNRVFDGVAADENFGDILNVRVEAEDPHETFAIDWLHVSFARAWAPMEGPETSNIGPAGLPTNSDTFGWDFVYNGDVLPEALVALGDQGWEFRPGETSGHPEYESIIPSVEAQTGGLWSRRDDNSPGSGSSAWANGFRIATDLYDDWNGKMTLVMRIRDLGTNAVGGKSVLDITNHEGNYWTLGHAAAGANGPAGWEWGQTADGRNANGTNNNTRTGGFGKFTTIRIVIEDNDPTDGVSFVYGYQDGERVYFSERSNDIGPGQLGEIAFRRTSGGDMQQMEIDWVAIKFGNAWGPGEGAKSPSADKEGNVRRIARPATETIQQRVQRYLAGEIDVLEPGIIDGVLGMDTYGLIKVSRDPSLPAGLNKLFETDRNGMPVNLSKFYLGFDAMRDIQTVGNPHGDLTGTIVLDRFGGLHTFAVQGPGNLATGPGVGVTTPMAFNATHPDPNTVKPAIAVTSPQGGPRFDYIASILEFNSQRPEPEHVGLPYFGTPFSEFLPEIVLLEDILGASDSGGLKGIARSLALAVDWRNATNAFRGVYMLDVFGGVHYIGEAEFMNLAQNMSAPTDPGIDVEGNETNFSTVGVDLFHEILGFKPIYLEDFAGSETAERKRAPYFVFDDDRLLPIARDIEVFVDWVPMTPELVESSKESEQLAIDSGIDIVNLYQPIAISEDRLNPASPLYTERVAVTRGYAIMDGFGGIHSLKENAEGDPIAAPWENSETGRAHRDVNAPYFLPFDLAVDFEIYPNGQGYALLTRTGEVYFINAVGTSREDNLAESLDGFEESIPFFGFDAARDLHLVPGEDGRIIGFYILDRFGTVYAIGDVPKLPSELLFLPTADLSSWQASKLQFSPFQSQVFVSGPETN